MSTKLLVFGFVLLFSTALMLSMWDSRPQIFRTSAQSKEKPIPSDPISTGDSAVQSRGSASTSNEILEPAGTKLSTDNHAQAKQPEVQQSPRETRTLGEDPNKAVKQTGIPSTNISQVFPPTPSRKDVLQALKSAECQRAKGPYGAALYVVVNHAVRAVYGRYHKCASSTVDGLIQGERWAVSPILGGRSERIETGSSDKLVVGDVKNYTYFSFVCEPLKRTISTYGEMNRLWFMRHANPASSMEEMRRDEIKKNDGHELPPFYWVDPRDEPNRMLGYLEQLPMMKFAHAGYHSADIGITVARVSSKFSRGLEFVGRSENFEEDWLALEAYLLKSLKDRGYPEQEQAFRAHLKGFFTRKGTDKPFSRNAGGQQSPNDPYVIQGLEKINARLDFKIPPIQGINEIYKLSQLLKILAKKKLENMEDIFSTDRGKNAARLACKFYEGSYACLGYKLPAPCRTD